MRYTHLCRLLVVGWFLCTVHSIGHAQPLGTGDLPPEVKALLKELRGGREGSTGLSELPAPSPGAVLENHPGAATSDGYEQTLLRYLALQKLATQTAVDHATALERQLQTLETELAGAATRSPQPPAVAETGKALSSERAAADSAGQQLLQDYDRLTQHLEEVAASSRAIAQRLRDLLR